MHSSNIHPDDCNGSYMSSFQPNLLPSNLDASGADSENSARPDGAYCHAEDNGARLFFSQMEHQPPRDHSERQLITKRHLSPAATPPGPPQCSLNRGHRAKRARVESIIKGMTSCPGIFCTDVITNQCKVTDCRDETKTQETSSQQEHTDRRGTASQSQVARKHIERQQQQQQQQQQQLRQLRTKFTQMDGLTEMTNNEDKYDTRSFSAEVYSTYLNNEFEGESRTNHPAWKKLKPTNCFQSKPERMKLMADALKYELSGAVNRSVDSVFQNMPFFQMMSSDTRDEGADLPLQSTLHGDRNLRMPCCRAKEGPIHDVQTEALSLVVPKPELMRADKLVLQSSPRTGLHPDPPAPLAGDFALRDNQSSGRRHGGAERLQALRRLADRCSEFGRSKLDSFHTQWSPSKVRSKVNSRCVRSPQTRVSVDAILLESLHLPRVKIESDSLKSTMYTLNEGLTTNHLKKAKLMFFFTRYPSSQVLKMCFHDVQFTRCITSQLIKWFSNFREFYYIQMEKFARVALAEGAADVRTLTVGRESELFRALNTHYNKANDFQVPDRFLEVAEVTLREFYVAISVGKDRDPSWKKAIYKVICKLDSEVPPQFKRHRSG